MFGKDKLKAEIERLKSENNRLRDDMDFKDSIFEGFDSTITDRQIMSLKESNRTMEALISSYKDILSDCYIRGPKGRFVKYVEEPTSSFKVYEKDLIGDIEGFPKEVVELMLERQYEQTGKVDIGVFQKHRTYGLTNMGFTWFRTKEGHDFWECVICDKNFDVFFEKYPKKLK